jgi:hypothetical protein
MPIKLDFPVRIPRDVGDKLLTAPSTELLIQYFTERGAEAAIPRHLVLWLWTKGYVIEPIEKEKQKVIII